MSTNPTRSQLEELAEMLEALRVEEENVPSAHAAESLEQARAALERAEAALRASEERHRATAEALRRSEERFALAMRAANDVLWDWDLRQNTFCVSSRQNEMLGANEGDDNGVAQWLERIHPEDIEALTRAMRAHILGETPYLENEYRLRRVDGSYVWVLVRGLSMRDATGSAYRIAGSLTDISQRKATEELLRRSEEHFRTLIEHSSDVITVSDEPGIFRYASPSIERVLGYRPEEVIGRSIFDFIHPDDAGTILIVRTESLRAPGTLRTTEVRMRHRTNGWRVIEAHGRSVQTSPGNVVIVLNARDVTEHKEAEQALRENEARFRTLAEAVAAATFIFQGTRLVHVNSTFEQITGYTRDELSHMDFWEVIHPDHRDLVRARGLARQRGVSLPSRYEVKLITKDNTERWVDFTAGLIEYDGEPAVLGTAFDITDRRRAEGEARERQLELAHVARLSTLGEMTAGLAHELNQPLAAIVNYARGCARRVETGNAASGELLEAVNSISTQARRASEILARVRDFVRKGKPRRDWVNLSDLAHDAARLAQFEAERVQMMIDLELAADLPLVNVDNVQIEQVILNLLANAIEAMHMSQAGRRLVIKTMRAGGDAVELTVCDTGSGLPADLADKVFDAFFSTKPGGLGLGLSISRSIIESHGGRLWASPNADHGTTFHFTLPIADRRRES